MDTIRMTTDLHVMYLVVTLVHEGELSRAVARAQALDLAAPVEPQSPPPSGCPRAAFLASLPVTRLKSAIQRCDLELKKNTRNYGAKLLAFLLSAWEHRA